MTELTVLHTDIPQRAEIDALMRVRTPSCASLYLPTDPRSTGEAERLDLRSLIREAIIQLRHADADTDDVAGIEAQVADVEDDDVVWRYQARTLAVFATPSSLITYRLPNRLQSQVAVSDRFHVSPLLRAITFPQPAFVLALAQGSVRVLEIVPDLAPQPVTVPDMPSDVASAVGKSSITDPAPARRIQGREGQKVRMRQFVRRVDQALRPFLPGQGVPLILAAAEPLDSIFRSLCHYPHLTPVTVTGNPEDLRDDQLIARAREVLDQWHATRLTALHDLFEQRSSQARTATDVADIARFATQGAVDTLFVDIDANHPGHVDDETGAVDFAESDNATRYGIVDEVTRRAWLTGGQILALRHDDIPGGGSLAAILRYTP
jgi:hypothetical protein